MIEARFDHGQRDLEPRCHPRGHGTAQVMETPRLGKGHINLILGVAADVHWLTAIVEYVGPIRMARQRIDDTAHGTREGDAVRLARLGPLFREHDGVGGDFAPL